MIVIDIIFVQPFQMK